MVISFSKKENAIVKWIRLCSICIAFTCVVFALQDNNVKYPVWLLPFIHAVGMFLLGDKNAVVSAPGIVTLNVVMFCRYEIVPLSIYLAQRISAYAINTYYIDQAIWLMVLELICILLMLDITGKRYKVRNNKVQNRSISQMFIPQNKNFIFLVVFIVLVAIAIQFPSMISGIGLILSGSLEVTSREMGFSGIVDMIWRSGLAWVYIYALSKIKDYDSSGKRSWVLIVIVTLLYVLFTFILNLSISRWYSVVCFIAATFLIGRSFPLVKRKVCIWTIIPVFIVLVIVSVYKNTAYFDKGNSDVLSVTVDLLDVSTLDIYCAGPGCVNNGLTLFHSGKGGLTSLLLDTLRNMPVINHYIDDSYSTVELYADLLGRGDMIIPLAIQSMIYFGGPLFGVLGSVSVVLIRKLDEQYLRADNAMVFVYGFIAAWFGVIFVLNYTVCISWFYAFIIPMWFLFVLTSTPTGWSGSDGNVER